MRKQNEWYEKMVKRVDKQKELKRHAATILHDWPEGEEHWKWAATAPIQNIIDWAEAVEAEDPLPKNKETA